MLNVESEEYSLNIINSYVAELELTIRVVKYFFDHYTYINCNVYIVNCLNSF